MKAMLFAAGLGTRLKPFTDHHPKALAEVNGKTLLEHNIRYLGRYGIDEVIVNVHHFADQIEQVIEQHQGFGSKVTISDERAVVLETGGGLKQAAPFFKDEPCFLVMNVDILTNLDLQKMIAAHDNVNTEATLAVMNRTSSRHLLFDEHMALCGWRNNGTEQERISRYTEETHPYAFSGIQIISQALLQDIQLEGKFSMIDVYLEAAKRHIIKGYDHSGDLLLDVGKPESILKAAQLFT